MFFLAFVSHLIIPVFRVLLILRKKKETWRCFAVEFRDSVISTSCIVRFVQELKSLTVIVVYKTQFQLHKAVYSSVSFIEW